MEHPAFGLYAAVHCVLLHQRNYLLFGEENCRAHVVVVLLHAGVATRCLSPYAALRRTEVAYFLTVLALIHNIIPALTKREGPLSAISSLLTQSPKQTQRRN